jgi:hypothetical protein
MTDDEINEIFQSVANDDPDVHLRFARAVLASVAGEPVAYVPRAHSDSENTVEGEYKWDWVHETPFEMNDPSVWECAPLYAGPVVAPIDTSPAIASAAALPPLPTPKVPNTRLPLDRSWAEGSFTAAQMTTYATAAVALALEGRGKP